MIKKLIFTFFILFAILGYGQLEVDQQIKANDVPNIADADSVIVTNGTNILGYRLFSDFYQTLGLNGSVIELTNGGSVDIGPLLSGGGIDYNTLLNRPFTTSGLNATSGMNLLLAGLDITGVGTISGTTGSFSNVTATTALTAPSAFLTNIESGSGSILIGTDQTETGRLYRLDSDNKLYWEPVNGGSAIDLTTGGADGSETILNPGTNVTISGSGTSGDPYIINATGGGGTSDHGALTGLGDDDHPQYFNQTRGDARYIQIGGNVNDADADPTNELELPDDSGATSGDLLTTDALGNFSWTNPFNNSALLNRSDNIISLGFSTPWSISRTSASGSSYLRLLGNSFELFSDNTVRNFSFGNNNGVGMALQIRGDITQDYFFNGTFTDPNDVARKSDVDAAVGTTYTAGAGLNLAGTEFSVNNANAVFSPFLRLNNVSTNTNTSSWAVWGPNSDARFFLGATSSASVRGGVLPNSVSLNLDTGTASIDFEAGGSQDYVFNASGPVNPNDVINKGYADENYGGGGSLTTDQTNRLANSGLPPKTLLKNDDFTVASNDVRMETSGNADLGRSYIMTVNDGGTTVATFDDFGVVDDVGRIKTITASDTFEAIPGTATLDWEGKTGSENAIRVNGKGHTAYFEKRATNSYFFYGDITGFEYSSSYSPNNLYTEASAVNADNQASTLGSWVNQSGNTSGLSVRASAPSGVTGGATESIGITYDSNLNPYERMVITVSGMTAGQSVTVRFYWRVIVGGPGGFQIEGRDGGARTLISSATTDTGWSATPFTYTFTPTTSTEDIRFYGNWNNQTVPNVQFEITNFEVID